MCKDTKWERKLKANVQGNLTRRNLAKISKVIDGMTMETTRKVSLAAACILEYLQDAVKNGGN